MQKLQLVASAASCNLSGNAANDNTSISSRSRNNADNNNNNNKFVFAATHLKADIHHHSQNFDAQLTTEDLESTRMQQLSTLVSQFLKFGAHGRQPDLATTTGKTGNNLLKNHHQSLLCY